MKIGLVAGAMILIVMAVPAFNSVPGKLPNVPASASRLRNPYAGRLSAAKAGAALYGSNCSMCHGEDARGSGAALNLRTMTTHAAADGSLFWFITNGDPEKGMPPFQKLSDQERWQIVTYIKSLSIAKTPPQ